MAGWTRQASNTAVDTASSDTLVYSLPAGLKYDIGDVLGIAVATEVSTTLTSAVDTQTGNAYDLSVYSNGSVATSGCGIIYSRVAVPLLGDNGDKITIKFGATSTGRACIIDQFRPPAGRVSGGIEASGGSASASGQSISQNLTSLTANDLGLMAVFNRASGTQPTTTGTAGFTGGNTVETILAINAGWLSLSYGLDASTIGTETMAQNIGALGGVRWRALLVKQVDGPTWPFVPAPILVGP